MENQRMGPPKLLTPDVYFWRLYYQVWSMIGRVLLLIGWTKDLVFNLLGFVFSLLFLPCLCMSGRNKVDQPVVVVTGASSGIGAEFAKQYARDRKAKLVLAARRVQKLEAVAKQCTDLGAAAAHAVAYDASEKNSGVKLRQDIENLGLGCVDVLFANAGVGGEVGMVEDYKDCSTVEWMMDINFTGYVRVMHGLLPLLTKSQRPQILANASEAALIKGFPGNPGYAATKAAVRSWMNGFRAQTYDQGIQMSTVYYGLVSSEMVQNVTTTDGVVMNAEKGKFGNMVNSVDKAVSQTIYAFDNGDTDIYFPSGEGHFIKWAAGHDCFMQSAWVLHKQVAMMDPDIEKARAAQNAQAGGTDKAESKV